MKTYYANDGKPGPDGRLCLIVDMEDGRPQPQRVYGANESEILMKLAGMYGNSAARLTEVKRELQQKTASPSPAAAAPSQAAPSQAAARAVVTDPARRIELTHELTHPSTSSQAAAALVESELGVPLSEVRAMVEGQQRLRMAEARAAMLQQWGDDHPEFPQSAINRNQMVQRATILAGGLEHITPAILDSTFAELLGKGLLTPTDVSPATPQPRDHTLVPSDARPRTTAANPSTFRATPPSTQSSRWTEQELERIITGPSKEYERLLKADPNFAQAVNGYVSKRQQQRRA